MVLSLDRWVGKVAIVTGASSGIGAAVAKQLVEKGLIVVGLARRSEIIQENAKKLSGEKGKLYAISTDMRKEEDIVKAFKWVDENLGHVHILINNAGTAKEDYLSNGNTENWKNVLDVNVLGLCIATREAVKRMQSNKIHGHIIHVNSVAGHTVPFLPGSNIYPATKHAVTALTKSLQQEFIIQKCKIKVTSLSPGFVETEMTTLNNEYTEKKQEMFKKLPIIEAENIADAVVYILSTPENVEVQELTISPVNQKL